MNKHSGTGMRENHITDFTGKNVNSNQTDIEEQVKQIKAAELKKISPLIFVKPAIISFFALIVTFFLDISKVPFLGEISIDLAKSVYPEWNPANQSIVPLQFWWLPPAAFVLFMLIAFKTYGDLRKLVIDDTPHENTERVISSAMSLVDGIATALPLIGAAILLVSIKLGPEIFLGISVPFEIKALIVLAIAKLFEPVLDTMGEQFQKILNRAANLRDSYYPKQQLEEIKKLVGYLESREKYSFGNAPKLSSDELKAYKENLLEVQKISFDTYQNFKAINQVLERMRLLLKNNQEHMKDLDELSKSIDSMAMHLNHEHVSKSLDNLNSIVNKKG